MATKGKVEIFKVKINENDEAKVLTSISDAIAQDKKLHIVTLNPEIMLLAKSNPSYRGVLNEANLTTIDGNGLLRAVKSLDSSFKGEITTGTDLLYTICDLSQTKKFRIFLLGGKAGVAREAKKRARSLYPACHIVGTIDGVEVDPYSTDTNLISQINNAKPDILFVALGAPKQEIWIHNNKELLRPKVLIGVGGALDYMSGRSPRAPKFIRSIGLEWLFRLTLNPSRIKRIYNATVVFTREFKSEKRTKIG